MATYTTTLSSVGTAAIFLDPVPRTTSVQISATLSSCLTTAFIEVTLDDPTTTPAPSIAWSPLSSQIISSAAAAAALYTVMSPIGGVRINSSVVTASSATWVLKVLQSVTA